MAPNQQANKARSERWYFRLPSSVLNNRMIADKLLQGEGLPLPNQRRAQDAEVGHHWHVDRGSNNEFVLVAFIYIIGFAMLITLMVYISSAGN